MSNITLSALQSLRQDSTGKKQEAILPVDTEGTQTITGAKTMTGANAFNGTLGATTPAAVKATTVTATQYIYCQ